MASVLKQRLTVQEFLAQEEVAQRKHEYYRGEVFAMAGASSAHSRIAFNILLRLGQQLDGKPCRVNISDVMVKADELLIYPDCSVVCPPIESLPGPIEVLLNPKVLVEVLSPSTEQYDRNFKLPAYGKVAGVTDILLVHQNAAIVERYVPRDGELILTQTVGLSGVVELASIGCRLPMAQIYDGVDVPENPFPKLADLDLRR